jgi:hypothetical protein
MEHHSSEANFRRYENAITTACLTYPKEVFLRNEGLALSTDTTRCRDAIASFREHKWTSTIDAVAYTPVLNAITTIPFLNHVIILRRQLSRLLVKKWRHDKQRDGRIDVANRNAVTIMDLHDAFYKEVAYVNRMSTGKTAILRQFPIGINTTDKSILDQFIVPFVTPANTEPMSNYGEEEKTYTIPEMVDMLDKGITNRHFLVDNTPENLQEVAACVGDRMNVAFVIEKSNNKIRIF